MKFAANVTYYLKDVPKEKLGISSASYSIGKNKPVEIATLMYALCKDAMEFALDAGIPTDVANESMKILIHYLEGVEIKEEKQNECNG